MPIGIALDVLVERRHARGLPGVLEAAAGAAHDVGVDVARASTSPFCSTTPICRRTARTSRLGQVLAVVVDAALARRLEAEQQAQQRRLARARRPDEGDELAGLDAQRDVVEDQRPVGAGSGSETCASSMSPVKLGAAARRRPRLSGGSLEDRLGALVERDDRDDAEHGAEQIERRSKQRREGGVEGEELPGASSRRLPSERASGAPRQQVEEHAGAEDRIEGVEHADPRADALRRPARRCGGGRPGSPTPRTRAAPRRATRSLAMPFSSWSSRPPMRPSSAVSCAPPPQLVGAGHAGDQRRRARPARRRERQRARRGEEQDEVPDREDAAQDRGQRGAGQRLADARRCRRRARRDRPPSSGGRTAAAGAAGDPRPPPRAPASSRVCDAHEREAARHVEQRRAERRRRPAPAMSCTQQRALGARDDAVEDQAGRPAG